MSENVSIAFATTVSIVTVTQYSRRTCLENLADLIKAQIYTNIVEWVIVEGSNNQADADDNQDYISIQWKKLSLLPLDIVYIPFNKDQEPAHRRLSDLRNIGNLRAIGEIIVCMDDDDYYPPTRVSHAVDRLIRSPALIAGCSRMYIYFYNTHQFFQCKGFGKNHSTNNCMAYKREYLQTNQHAPSLSKAEESSFTNHFTEPMVQLDPNKCIVVSGHGNNTVDKTWLCEDTTSEPGKNRMFKQIDPEEIFEYIPMPIYKKMAKMFKAMD
jgi:glycosyltransferase involved in cell wall biosynthesis